MALRSIKDKIANVAGSEVLGEMEGKAQDLTEEKKRVTSRTKQQRPKRIVKQEPEKTASKPVKKRTEAPKVTKGVKVTNEKKENKPRRSLFSREKEVSKEEEVKAGKRRNEIQRGDERVDDLVTHEEGTMEGYKDVLAILGIKEKIELDVDFRSHDLDYINFGQTTPVGLDYDEVSDFISRTKYTLHKLESTLKQREKDVVAVASEVKRIEQRMIEQNQEKELERMVGGMTQEERLIEEVMELRVDNNELKRERDMLKQEVDELKSTIANQVNTEKVEVESGNKLPTPPVTLKEEDIFGDMLNDIGGLYDE